MRLTALILVIVFCCPIASAAVVFTLDGDTPGTGSNLDTTPFVNSCGTTTWTGLFEFSTGSDPDTDAAGASGNKFDILSSGNPPVALNFDFDVSSITLIYGGNAGGITITVRDGGGGILDQFIQGDTSGGQPAGPITLNGPGIRSLEWNDHVGGTFAILDNIVITVVPEPSSLGLLGLAFLGLFGRRRPE